MKMTDPKLLAMSVDHHTAVVFTDSSGRDIAAVIVNDRQRSRVRLVFKVPADIKVRREIKE